MRDIEKNKQFKLHNGQPAKLGGKVPEVQRLAKTGTTILGRTGSRTGTNTIQVPNKKSSFIDAKNKHIFKVGGKRKTKKHKKHKRKHKRKTKKHKRKTKRKTRKHKRTKHRK
jgi:hypothetical protein